MEKGGDKEKMKLSCTQENLTRGLNLVSRLASTRSTLPILSHIQLSTDRGRLKLQATDLEIGIKTWIGAKVEKEGSVTVPGRLISEFVSMNTDKKLNLIIKDQTLNITSERFQANIKGTSSEEFPLIPQVKEESFISVPAKTLEEAIREVIIAVALDETRPALSGVYLKTEDSKLKMVATDSYRLAEKTIPLENKAATQKAGVIIPAKTMHELLRILGAIASEQVKIYLAQNQVQFNVDKNIELVSRLIEGTFPNYEQIIPTNYQTKISLEAEEFTNGLKVANLFARESANNIKIEIKTPGSLFIKAVAGQVGDNLSQISCQAEGNNTSVAFNAKFLLDALSVISSPKIDLEISGKLSPGVIRPADSKNYLYIIMPLRTEE